jgi:transposase
MCSHYLFEPVACTPASGWEKGQVENQVGLVRERMMGRSFLQKREVVTEVMMLSPRRWVVF